MQAGLQKAQDMIRSLERSAPHPTLQGERGRELREHSFMPREQPSRYMSKARGSNSFRVGEHIHAPGRGQGRCICILRTEAPAHRALPDLTWCIYLSIWLCIFALYVAIYNVISWWTEVLFWVLWTVLANDQIQEDSHKNLWFVAKLDRSSG